MNLSKSILHALKSHPDRWVFTTNDRFLHGPEGVRLVRPVVSGQRWSLCLPWGLVRLSWRAHMSIEWMRRGSKVRRMGDAHH